MIAKMLSHYRILEKIGQGGMGEVYRAHDEHLNRDVAIKVLPAGVLADEAARKRFRKEALALSQFNHPNVETVHDFDTQEGVDFLVMEYVAGATLAEKLADGPLPEKEVTRLGAQITQALEEARARGVVHRDLKPANIVVTPRGQVKILDFGLAKLLRPVSEAAVTDSLTETQVVAGTLPYMAPEQLRGAPIDPRTDLYALGVVLYEMATGRLPFTEKLPTALVDDILHKPPPPPGRFNPDLSSRLEQIILKALEKDPERRYQSAKELRIDLERLSTPTTLPTVPSPQAPAWGKSGKRWAVGGVAVLLLAGMAIGIILWYQKRVTPASPTLAAKPSVAVLPFQNLSAEPENEYFSDGMTEEIISKLSRIQGLRVASRTSVVRYKGTQKDIKEIGRELGVRYVLEGSVRKAANRVRITAQLIDTATGFHLWSDDFDGDLKDVFAVQEQTALKIADALNLRLSPQEQQALRRRYTDNPQAYDAYLRGQALIRHSDPERLEAGRRHFERALQSDPNYAPALAGLAHIEGLYYRNVDAKPVRLERAEQLARRALALDPKLSDAHVALGIIHGCRFDYVRAAEKFREAVRLDPENPHAWDWLSWALAYQQPPDAVEAEKAAREAIRLQPTLFPGHYHLARALILQQRYEEAVVALQYSLELSPTYPSARLGLAQVYLAQARYDRALAELQKLPTMTPMRRFYASSIYAARGEKEKALAELDKVLAGGYRDFAAIEASPYFASLRSDPRFQQLLRRYRLP